MKINWSVRFKNRDIRNTLCTCFGIASFGLFWHQI